MKKKVVFGAMTILLAFVLCFSLTACSDEDPSAPPPNMLFDGVWRSGELTSSEDEIYLIFPVKAGNTYYVWWNDSYAGDKTKTGDVVVGARAEGSATWFWGGSNMIVDSAWASPRSINADTNTIVELRIIPFNLSNNRTGTFSIVYRENNNTRPDGG